MITELDIKGFRCFEHLRVPGLTRVNLLVGKNNSGKTTVLEAVELLHLGSIALARGPIRRREELLPAPSAPRDSAPEIDISHLFHGRRPQIAAAFSIADPTDETRTFLCRATGSQSSEALPREVVHRLTIEHGKGAAAEYVSLSELGGLDEKWRRTAFAVRETWPDLQFVEAGVADLQWLARLWDDVTLTAEEATVYDVLRIAVPALERLAFLGAGRQSPVNALVKLAGTEPRLPLGTLGDGMRRLLSLALHLVASRGGVLLVDEIDTGLHHSVMTKMWRLVIETARRLDVQVFATTHSDDCVRSLAEAAELDAAAADDVSLHRIDPGEEETMRYSAADLLIATRGHIEVR